MRRSGVRFISPAPIQTKKAHYLKGSGFSSFQSCVANSTRFRVVSSVGRASDLHAECVHSSSLSRPPPDTSPLRKRSGAFSLLRRGYLLHQPTAVTATALVCQRVSGRPGNGPVRAVDHVDLAAGRRCSSSDDIAPETPTCIPLADAAHAAGAQGL
jgi:hypothetical protein